jgi:hypothetical protein
MAFNGDTRAHLSRSPFPSLRFCMKFIMDAVYFCSMFAGLLPMQLEFIPVLLLWSALSPVIPLHQAPFVPSASCTRLPMTRPRGRPRRGSPWKPRRPPITPPDSTSDDSSPRHQSDFTPVSLQALQLSSMAVIPRTPIALLRLFQDSPAGPPSLVPSHDPPGNLECGPCPQEAPKVAGLHPQDSFDKEQFRNSLSVLHNLVFELRQEVADLHFRMQATEVKVASFLQIISSMHAALFPDPVEAVKNEGRHHVPSPVDISKQKDACEGDTEGAERSKEAGKQWSDETTYIEEEPWPGDLSATRPSYLPGV